ncbi:MAG TPA: hypothetical protein VEU32_01875 [Burkholderiales bacterium]|nr:hypothetical protein [Burkholderiales bacterium]
MSEGGAPKPAAGHAAPAKDPYVDLAERIFVNLAARVYGTLAGGDAKKPDPKALAAFSFKLADAFEQATDETPRKRAEIEARNKASVKLADVDVSSFFNKPGAPAEPPKK